MQTTCLTCDICNKHIHCGAPYIALSYNIEYLERDLAIQTDFVNTITSDQILTKYGKCGNKRNTTTAQKTLKNSFKLAHPILN
jgi:hypothetical protein